MGKNYTKEKFFNSPESKKRQDAKRSLNSYINQMKLHFDLNERDIVEVIEHVYRNNKNDMFKKKWWHLWK
jgi:hemerythrin-like domain-containing protein